MNLYLNIIQIISSSFHIYINIKHIYINIKNEHESSCDKFII